MSRKFLFILSLLPLCGCVQRTMTITSTPDGALVYLNGEEVGRTPLTRDFTWYGTYDVQLRKEGYETLSTKTPVIAPIWQWPPLDIAAELWPGHMKDERHFSYSLNPATPQPMDTAALLARAGTLRGKLESSERPPTTAPATKPAQ